MIVQLFGKKDGGTQVIENVAFITVSEYNKTIEFSGRTKYNGEMVVKIPMRNIEIINVEVENEQPDESL